MFRWHSTVVEPGAPLQATSSVEPIKPTKELGECASDLLVSLVFDLVNVWGEQAERKPDGSLRTPSAMLRMLEEKARVRLGPEGGGTLLAIVDKRRPTRDEVIRCLSAPGSQVLPRQGPARPAGSGHSGSGRTGSGRAGSGRAGSGRLGSGRAGSGRAGSGRGLGHLMGSTATTGGGPRYGQPATLNASSGRSKVGAGCGPVIRQFEP